MKKTALFLFLLTSCHSGAKFSSEKWKQAPADPAFPNEHRREMVANLVQSGILKDLDSMDVIRLLGQPDYNEGSVLMYTVDVDYSHDIDPVKQTNLNVTFDKGRVTNVFLSK